MLELLQLFKFMMSLIKSVLRNSSSKIKTKVHYTFPLRVLKYTSEEESYSIGKTAYLVIRNYPVKIWNKYSGEFLGNQAMQKTKQNKTSFRQLNLPSLIWLKQWCAKSFDTYSYTFAVLL